MSRSFQKSPCWHITWNRNQTSRQDKQMANKAVRRTIRRAIKNCQDYEDIYIPNRLECAHNEIWDWRTDGKAHWQFEHEKEGMPDGPIIEISDEEQVARVLDGLPAINTFEFDHDLWHRGWFKRMLRK